MVFSEFYLYLSVAYLFLGLFIFTEKPESNENRTFGFISLGISLWVGGFYLLSETSWWHADKVALLGGIIAVAGFFHFSRIYPNKLRDEPSQKNAFGWVQFLPLFLLALLVPFNFFINSQRVSPHHFRPINGPLYPLLALTELAYISAAVWNFFQQVRLHQGVTKQKAYYLISSLGAFLVITTICDLLLPLLKINELKFVGPLSSLVFAGTAVLGLSSYRYPDLRVLSTKILYLIISLSGAFAAWALFYDFSPRQPADLVLEFIVAIGIFFALKAFLSKVTGKLLLGSFRRSNRILADLSQELTKELSTHRILMLVNDGFAKSLNLKWVFYHDLLSDTNVIGSEKHYDINREVLRGAGTKFYVQNAENGQPTYFDSGPISGLMPIRLDDELQGYFIFGPQSAWYGLGPDQLDRANQIHKQILTAYSRALLFENLEKTVAEQVQDLEYKNRKLAEIMESRLEFLQMTSHQLRTPVSALTSSMELLARNDLENSERNELIEMSRQKIKNLSSIIAGILQLSRVERTENPDVHQKVNLKNIFENLAIVLEPLRNAKNINLEFHGLADVEVLGNQVYLEQAIFNILDNAMRHSGATELVISVAPSADVAVIKISDNGKGIPMEFQSNIFAKKSKTQHGSGLGLYLAKTIIDLHEKGHIWMDSEDRGTAFFIRLKLYA